MTTNDLSPTAQGRELRVGNRATTLHLALPSAPPLGGVLVLHPWWGLNDDVRRFADRLAAAGFAVGAPDLYEGRVVSAIEDADRLSSSLDEDVADAFVLAAVDELGAAIGDPMVRIGTVGFSMGGAWALWLPAQRREVVATVVYYGSMQGPSLSRARTPVLGHFAETDPYEPDDELATFESTLRTAGRDVQIRRYPRTGHWFAEPSRDAYDAGAAELAFERTVAFLQEHLGSGF